MLEGTATFKDILEASWDWWVVRKKPRSLHENPYYECSYRNGDNRCAFGIFITDDKYVCQMEGLASDMVIDRFVPEIEKYRLIIQSLQKAHDTYKFSDENPDFTEYMRHKLELISNEYQVRNYKQDGWG